MRGGELEADGELFALTLDRAHHPLLMVVALRRR